MQLSNTTKHLDYVYSLILTSTTHAPHPLATPNSKLISATPKVKLSPPITHAHILMLLSMTDPSLPQLVENQYQPGFGPDWTWARGAAVQVIGTPSGCG